MPRVCPAFFLQSVLCQTWAEHKPSSLLLLHSRSVVRSLSGTEKPALLVLKHSLPCDWVAPFHHTTGPTEESPQTSQGSGHMSHNVVITSVSCLESGPPLCWVGGWEDRQSKTVPVPKSLPSKRVMRENRRMQQLKGRREGRKRY